MENEKAQEVQQYSLTIFCKDGVPEKDHVEFFQGSPVRL